MARSSSESLSPSRETSKEKKPKKKEKHKHAESEKHEHRGDHREKDRRDSREVTDRERARERDKRDKDKVGPVMEIPLSSQELWSDVCFTDRCLASPAARIMHGGGRSEAHAGYPLARRRHESEIISVDRYVIVSSSFTFAEPSI